MKPLLIALLAACLACGACQKPVARLNAPPHGETDNPSQLQTMYTQLLDNALLEDMSVSDVHFLPHRATLNSLGEERLSRLADLKSETVAGVQKEILVFGLVYNLVQSARAGAAAA